MMKRLSLVFTAALSLSVPAVHAQATSASDLYGEVGYTHFHLSSGGRSSNPGMLRVLAGVEVHPHVALEGMLAWGVRSDSSQVTGFDIETGTGHGYGVFVKPHVSVTPQLQLFGRLGWVHSKTKTKVSFGGLSSTTTSSDSDVAYGVGGTYQLSPHWDASLDAMRYYDKNGATADGLTAGVRYRF